MGPIYADPDLAALTLTPLTDEGPRSLSLKASWAISHTLIPTQIGDPDGPLRSSAGR